MPGYEFFGDEERKEVQDVTDSGILMRYGFDKQRQGHWKAKELEEAICQKLNVKHTQLTSSGTAALTTAMAALGIGEGDEIILPCFTFVASFEAILSVGATPVFVDIDESLTLDPKAVEAAISPRTKAIMPVHMCGSMADMEALLNICRERKLFLLEDACQAIGGTYKGRYLGTIGDAGTFSFDFVKTITCGEGGAVMTNNKDIYTKCDAYTDHGHDHLGIDRGADLHEFIGYNFRISELHAAVGLAQIRKLDQFLQIQRSNKAFLKAAIAEIPGIQFRKVHDPAGDSATFLSFFLPTAEIARKVIGHLKAAGLAAFYYFDNNWHYIRNWHHLKSGSTVYPLNPGLKKQLQNLALQSFEQSDDLISRSISIPINLSWTENDLLVKKDILRNAILSEL
jgi:8-amino-3,8-dideoxy-alpha-D-manno-octulosonate transaminase